ncbi:nitric oxide-sensing protein NosP [Halomonas getboli]|uniref:nitric oxide-sensing protein NosP n=1 Tax=Halomonas getboli TaxID=2935862 RepID=UPI001FFFA74D|nr:nitric oxide-sensing protein NosP [Halomonas getboli]MCK2184560.1 FIST C-terminal domain-containing protein [Halomonas getboli]
MSDLPAAVSSPRTAASDSRDPERAAAELAEALAGPELGFVLFFCSADYPLAALGEALERAFSPVPLAGCTTAGEITPTGYGRGCIVAIGFDRDDFAIACARIADLDAFALPQAQRLVDGLLADCRRRTPGAEARPFVLTLLDGLSSSEEQVLATLEAALGGIPSFGGSAGDDNRLSHTHVYADGGFHDASAVVVMIASRRPFEVFTTHHLRPRGEKLVVTAVDRERRRVLELNAAPAAEEYARLVGRPVAELDAGVFARHPLAVRIGEAYYVRSIQRVDDDGGLRFYCAVENGLALTAMRPAPMLDELSGVLDRLQRRLGPPALILGCDCFLRRLELEALGQLDDASRRLAEARVVGFNTYGEQHQGMHINQTFTGVAIGSRR